jgi:hypothetical protein
MKNTLSAKIAGLVLMSFLLFTASVFGNDSIAKSSIKHQSESLVYELLNAGTESLLNGYFEDAYDQYHKAYLAYPDSKEAIVYSSLADLAAITTDPSIVSLMNDRFGIVAFHGIMDVFASEVWMKAYRTYDNDLAYPELSVPDWFKGTGAYQDSLIDGKESEYTWALLLLANFIDKNDQGLNRFIDDIINGALGAQFEELCTRIEKLSRNDSIRLSTSIIETFNEIAGFDLQKIRVGRAELEGVTILLRFLKASLEWSAAYNWDTDLSFLEGEWYDIDVYAIDTLTPTQLPFKNDFLTDRHNDMMSKSKTDYQKVLKTIGTWYDYLVSSDNKRFTDIKEELNEYLFVRYSLDLLVTAIKDGSVIWLPAGSLEGIDTVVGVDFGRYFTPGYLTLNQFIALDSTNKRPLLVNPWFEQTVPSDTAVTGLEFNAIPLKGLFPGVFDDVDDKIFIELEPEIAQKVYKLYY